MKQSGNIDEKYRSCTTDSPIEDEEIEIDKNWADIAKLSSERWSKDNPFGEDR